MPLSTPNIATGRQLVESRYLGVVLASYALEALLARTSAASFRVV